MVVLLVLAVIAGGIAGGVEVLNARAGYYLPRSATDTGKWRTVSISLTRQMLYPKDPTGQPVTRPLTQAETNRLTKAAMDAERNNQLRRWVGTAGLLQYPLLLAIGLGLITTTTSRRRLLHHTPSILLFTCALVSLLYRGYFSALAW